MAWVIINRWIGAWPPDAMERMTLDELYAWYDMAVQIYEQQKQDDD